MCSSDLSAAGDIQGSRHGMLEVQVGADAFDHQRVKVRSGFGVPFGGAGVREEVAHGFQ